MMKQFTSHLDYLIQGNDCVIIPDFGGFVLNKESAFVSPDGSINPPRVVVGFNPDLTYNDGLLAESFMYVYSISYDAACKKIRDAVDNLNLQLSQKRTVRIGRLGKLNFTENGQLNFVPDQNISLHYPDTYGLSFLNIKPIPKVEKISETRAKLYKLYAGIGGAAAAILVFFVTSTTSIVQETDKNIQKSGFFIDALTTSGSEKVADIYPPLNHAAATISGVADSNAVAADTTKTVIADTKNTLSVESSTNVKPKVKTTRPSYYIVVGSARSKSELNRISNLLKKDGIKNINVLDLGKNKYCIYVSSFKDKSQAQDYLTKFRKSTVRYKDAWIYTAKAKS